MIFVDYWKVLVLNFSEMEIGSFLIQKVNGIFELCMIFQNMESIIFRAAFFEILLYLKNNDSVEYV